MPRELQPHFSPRLSDTGPNPGYRCDPSTKGEGCSILLSSNLTSPFEQSILLNIKIIAVRHPSVCQSRRSNRRADNTSPESCVPGVGFMLINAEFCLQSQFEECTFCTRFSMFFWGGGEL